jgi:hypothetical protein
MNKKRSYFKNMNYVKTLKANSQFSTEVNITYVFILSKQFRATIQIRLPINYNNRTHFINSYSPHCTSHGIYGPFLSFSIR